MKTAAVLASTLAIAGNALAAPAESWFTLQAKATGKPVDNLPLKAAGGWFFLGKATTSDCGDVSPVVTVGSSGFLAFYADGKQNQQQAYVDISGAADGLLAFTKPDQQTNPSQVTDKFSIAGAEQDQLKLMYDGDSNWLACPAEDAGAYYIYPAKSYSKPVGKDKCTEFEIQAASSPKPTTVCVYN